MSTELHMAQNIGTSSCERSPEYQVLLWGGVWWGGVGWGGRGGK